MKIILFLCISGTKQQGISLQCCSGHLHLQQSRDLIFDLPEGIVYYIVVSGILKG
jgi:hypothetical protein